MASWQEMGKISNFTDSERLKTPKTECVLKFRGTCHLICSRTLFKMLQIHICERLVQHPQIVSTSPQSHQVVCWFGPLHIHNVNTVRFQTWDQSPYNTNFEFTTYTHKNPINLVDSLSLSIIVFRRIPVDQHVVHERLLLSVINIECALCTEKQARAAVYILTSNTLVCIREYCCAVKNLGAA